MIGKLLRCLSPRTQHNDCVSQSETDRWGEDRLVADATEELFSPSGRFRLLIRYYDQGKGYWRFSRGTVYRVSDGVEMADVKRNYSRFHHSFVNKNGHEYLISGRSYLSQVIVNLDTGIEFDNSGQGDGYNFCWAKHWLSADGNTLVVNGCFWAGPYEFKFFDFTDPAQGWPELELPQPLYEGGGDTAVVPVFEESGIIAIRLFERLYVPLQKYEYDLLPDEISDEAWEDDELWRDDLCKTLRLLRNENAMVLVPPGYNPQPNLQSQIERTKRCPS